MKNSIPPAYKKRPQRTKTNNWHYHAVAIACCTILVTGFFLAARQHFTSMEYGLQNSRLRRQLDELQAEKRKLLVSREVSMSPVELRKAAKRIGFMDTPMVQPSISKSVNQQIQTSVIKTIEASQPASTKPAGKVIKTVITAPVTKNDRLDKQARRDTISVKKDRT